jgi:excisionase family DNA binding protein
MRDLAVGRAPAKHAGNKAQRKSDQDSYHTPEAVSDGKYVAFTASLAPPQTDEEAEKAPDECAHERNGDPGTDHSARRLCAERGENVVALRRPAHESRSRERLPEPHDHHEVRVKGGRALTRDLHDPPLAAEVAELLALSTSTVLDWFEAGRFPGFKRGRTVRFRHTEIVNPAALVPNPEPKRTEVQTFSLDELEAVAAELSPTFRAIPVFAALTGLRPANGGARACSSSPGSWERRRRCSTRPTATCSRTRSIAHALHWIHSST